MRSVERAKAELSAELAQQRSKTLEEQKKRETQDALVRRLQKRVLLLTKVPRKNIIHTTAVIIRPQQCSMADFDFTYSVNTDCTEFVISLPLCLIDWLTNIRWLLYLFVSLPLALQFLTRPPYDIDFSVCVIPQVNILSLLVHKSHTHIHPPP